MGFFVGVFVNFVVKIYQKLEVKEKEFYDY